MSWIVSAVVGLALGLAEAPVPPAPAAEKLGPEGVFRITNRGVQAVGRRVEESPYPERRGKIQISVDAAGRQRLVADDPYGFTAWLNATRASYGLGAVGYDPNLTAWAHVNNGRQRSYGMGHHVMGTARRQNAAMCSSVAQACQMWMQSPGHRAALLDPSIRTIGIAGLGAYWTFNGN